MRRLHLKYVYCLLTMLLLCGTAQAQRFPFRNLSVDNGLIQSQAMCLAQDVAGNLWVGTLGGLSRFDGQNFTNYTVRNGLPANMVMSLAADSLGNIWIGGSDGISRFDGKKYTHYQLPHAAARGGASRLQHICIVRDTVWWQVGGEVYYIVNGKIKYLVTPGAQTFVSAMLAEPGNLYLAKDSFLYHRNGDRWDSTAFGLAPGDPMPTIHCIFRDRAGNVWLGTNGGLYHVEDNRLKVFRINNIPLNYPAMLSIAQDKMGALWIGTYNGGVIKLGDNSLQVYNKKNGLSDNTFFDVMTDAEGNIWMASDGQGIFRFSGTLFTGLDESMGLPSAQVMTIAGNRRDSLFLGTYDAGLFVYHDGVTTPLPFPTSAPPALTSVVYSHDHKLWIGTRGSGLWEYTKNTFYQFTAPQHKLTSNFITRLYEDPEDRLWIGLDDAIMLKHNDTFSIVMDKSASVSSFLYIGQDSVLIATESGLKLYDRGTITPFLTHTATDSSQIQCMTMTPGILWLGSSDNGIIRYDMRSRKATIINKSNGLRSDFIYNITADNEGNIWAGTGYGIHKITVSPNGDTHITFYGKEQGVTGMESNLGAALKLPDGSIWFGTTNGALHYQPHSEVVSSAPFSILLKSVKLTGENTIDPSYYDSTDNWYGIPYHLRLPYRKNTIAFSFQAVTLSGGEQVLYRYRMDGIDAPWSDWSGMTSVTYSALPPGKYVFHVQCMGEHGKQNPELTYAFEIITPFQKTSWFRLLVLAACLLLGVFLQYLFNSRKERRHRLRARLRAEEQAKIRLRTAEDFHDEIGNKLTRINVLANVLKSKVPQTPDVTRILGQIEENTSLLYGGTRDILWSLKPSNDSLYEILLRILEFGNELFEDTPLKLTVSGISEQWRGYRLPMDTSRNLIMIFKEALNNALKYSGATEVNIHVEMKRRDVLNIVMKDNGKGFDPQSVTRGNGLQNMQIRAGRLNGKLYVDSRPGKGTILSLTFKIPRNR